MPDLTLTHEVRSYLTFTVVLLGLSGSTVASRFHQRWLHRGGFSFAWTYGATLSVTIALAALIVDFGRFVVITPGHLTLSIALGFALGWSAFVVDRAINRRILRRGVRRGQAAGPRRRELRARTAMTAADSPAARDDGRGRHVVRPTGVHGLAGLFSIAVLEEVVFRGVLIAVALSIHVRVLGWLLVAAAAVLFALEHLHFGWPHVLGKLPFSVLATLATLVVGSLMLPIVAHVTLNALVYRHLQEASRSVAGLRAAAAGGAR